MGQGIVRNVDGLLLSYIVMNFTLINVYKNIYTYMLIKNVK